MRAADRGLFRDSYERDSCGFGLIAQLDDQPSHWLVKTAMASLNRLTHRGAVAEDGKTGDGSGTAKSVMMLWASTTCAQCTWQKPIHLPVRLSTRLTLPRDRLPS